MPLLVRLGGVEAPPLELTSAFGSLDKLSALPGLWLLDSDGSRPVAFNPENEELKKPLCRDPGPIVVGVISGLICPPDGLRDPEGPRYICPTTEAAVPSLAWSDRVRRWAARIDCERPKGILGAVSGFSCGVGCEVGGMKLVGRAMACGRLA